MRAGLGSPSFRLMLGATALGFGGYALLLPVVPLWVVHGGSGAFGAGSSTGVLLLATVITQLGVPWLLRRWGHRLVLGAGLVLLGGPVPLLMVSAELGPVLAVSAVRGIGFGFLTVAGSALVAELVSPSEHGRATARYGLAVGLPQLAVLPAGVAVVGQLGFPVVFLAGAVPLLGVLLVPFIGMRPVTSPASHPAERVERLRRSAVGPTLAMLACSTAQGGLVTFLPLAAADPGLVAPIALFGTAAGALLGRLAAGELVDRRGLAGRLLWPGVLVAALGMAAEVLTAGVPGAAGGAGLAAGALVVGLGFGLVQNDALVALFAAAGPQRYGTASAVWNIAYDAGTAAGAVGLGAIAEPFGFRAAFGAAALLLVLTAPFTRARDRQAR
ncbi:MFS transporter [Pseudonocardia asaccharolytica]|uniref:MFS transporter n=1 Tax=Pseudonocardia asaccharolytica DSM 44247 = NBRC 16224 TaxID=1123024 RepID=A0A511DBV3_9PSEU|nr:MFS transporter [Pseudonocardia asaccharolytica]GEL20428.1 MFS transporter [Pseudonocardia asaccharolytica DSM 44247 = NBRC 16224]